MHLCLQVNVCLLCLIVVFEYHNKLLSCALLFIVQRSGTIKVLKMNKLFICSSLSGWNLCPLIYVLNMFLSIMCSFKTVRANLCFKKVSFRIIFHCIVWSTEILGKYKIHKEWHSWLKMWQNTINFKALEKNPTNFNFVVPLFLSLSVTLL